MEERDELSPSEQRHLRAKAARDARKKARHSNAACGIEGVPDGTPDYFDYGLQHPTRFAGLAAKLSAQFESGVLEGLCVKRVVSLFAGSSPKQAVKLLRSMLESKALDTLHVDQSQMVRGETLSFLHSVSYTLADVARHGRRSEVASIDAQTAASAYSALVECSDVSYWDRRSLAKGDASGGLALAQTRACLNGLLRMGTPDAYELLAERLAVGTFRSRLSDVHLKFYTRELAEGGHFVDFDGRCQL